MFDWKFPRGGTVGRFAPDSESAHSAGACSTCYTAPMQIDLARERTARRSRPWVEVTLVSGFVFSLLLGLVALGALLILQREEPLSLTTPPLQTIQPDRVIPQLALAELAGDPAEALAYQAAAAGESETARAIALFTTHWQGSERLGLLLHLGRRFAEEEAGADAASLFNLARSAAILDPALSASERSLALVQAANGLHNAGESAAALDAATQALRVAEQAPGLLPAQRSQILESLRPLARQLGDRTFTQELAELARNPFIDDRGVLLPGRWPSLATDLVYDPDVQAAVEQRELAARLLADRILLTGGADIAPEIAALASALVAEDQIRNEYYRRSLAAGLPLEQQFALLQDRRAWAALRLRTAMLGFGISLVPEWEQAAAQIEQELGVATANLNLIVEAQANALPEPADQVLLRAEGLFWATQQMELGLYPGGVAADLDAQLGDAQSELERLGSPLALPVAYDAAAMPPGFRIRSTR